MECQKEGCKNKAQTYYLGKQYCQECFYRKKGKTEMAYQMKKQLQNENGKDNN